MSEEWRPVPGFEGLYEVSDQGRVKSLPKIANGAHGCVRHLPERIIKGSLVKASDRYHRRMVYLTDGKQHYVHHLVLLAFKGPCPPELERRHLNGNPLDNRLSNLEYSTHQDNMDDKYDHGTALFGEKNHQAKLTTKDILEIRDTPGTQEEIATIYGISQRAVGLIKSRKRWRHVL
jgi:NUMOD4 motif/HNH endonuclease